MQGGKRTLLFLILSSTSAYRRQCISACTRITRSNIFFQSQFFCVEFHFLNAKIFVENATDAVANDSK